MGLGKSHYGKGPKGYKRSDERIKEDVSDILARNHEIDASDIEVFVEDGHVTLKGTIESRQLKRFAEDAIERCAGVQDISNQLKITSLQSPNPQDSTLESSSSPSPTPLRSPPSQPGSAKTGSVQ